MADDLRGETMRAVAGLRPLQRIALALRLGDDDVELYRSAHGAGEREARAALARARAVGRVPSRSNDPDRV